MGHSLKAFRTAILLASLFFPVTAQAQSQAQRDAEYLQEFIVPLAQMQLERTGEFLPIAAALKPSDKFVLIPVLPSMTPLMPVDIIRHLQVVLAREAANGNYKTTALVYDATVPLPSSGKPSDAIAVALDHQDGYSVITFLPYELHGKKLQMGTPFTQQGTASVFQKK